MNKLLNEYRISRGRVTVDLLSDKVTYEGNYIEVSPTPVRFLKYFMAHPKRIISRGEFTVNLFPGVHLSNRVIDSHISKLRKDCPFLDIRSLNNQGYYFEPDTTPL